MEDPSWQCNCDTLVRSLQALDRKTGVIHRSTNKLVSVRDINKERERIRQTTSSANSVEVQAIQGSARLVEQFIRQNPTFNNEGMRLVDESKAALARYQSACDSFYKKCISVEEASRSKQASRARGAFQDNSDDEAETAGLLDRHDSGDGEQLDTAKAQFERDLYADLMAERARETKEIADNVNDINEIFNHIHEMVDEQGVQLDIVDGNLSAAERATSNANRHLSRAQQYQQTSSRNKWLMIFVVILFLLVCLSLIAG